MGNLIIRLFVKDYKNIENLDVRQKYGIVCGIVGIVSNLCLFVAKFVASFLSGSIAIAADAFNNLSDAGSSIVTLIGFKLAGQPADKAHPFGHGRFEYVSGLIVSMIIIIVGFELLMSSAQKIMSPQEIEFSYTALIILVLSIAIKLWMALFNKKIGRKINSATLIATALDSLSDVVATTSVVISMVISKIFEINLDGYAGAIVAIFIMYTGFNSAKDTLNLLLGEAPSQEFVKRIEEKVLEYKQVKGVHDLIVHNYGPGRSVVSLHAEVPCNVDILEIHDTIDNIERNLKKEMDCEVVIHMDPIATDCAKTNEIKAKISTLIKLIDPSLNIHDFRMVEGATHTNLIFDIVVPHKFRLNDDEVRQTVLMAAKTIDEKFEIVINVDKSYS